MPSKTLSQRVAAEEINRATTDNIDDGLISVSLPHPSLPNQWIPAYAKREDIGGATKATEVANDGDAFPGDKVSDALAAAKTQIDAANETANDAEQAVATKANQSDLSALESRVDQVEQNAPGPSLFRSVATLTARNDIPEEDRLEGMKVWVAEASVTYRLGVGLTNADWVPDMPNGILSSPDVIVENLSIPDGANYAVFGPTTIAEGVELTIESGGSLSYLGADNVQGESLADPMLRCYVQIYNDPTTDMTITWHAASTSSLIEYREDGDADWITVGGSYKGFPLRTENVHSVHLTGLTPDTTYEFRAPNVGYWGVRKFKTVSDALPVRFVFASDCQEKPMDQIMTNPASKFNLLNNIIGDREPDFVIAGGDYVECEGIASEKNSQRWVNWLEAIQARHIRDDGTMIPICYMTGNHETTPSYNGNGVAAYLQNLTTTLWNTRENNPGRGYGYFTIGNKVLVLLIDSHHASSIYTQVEWVQSTLSELAGDYEHVIITSHFPAYAIHERWHTGYVACETLRREIMPILSGYPNIRFYLVGHQHVADATKPLYQEFGETNGNPNRWYLDDDGIVQIGSGGWGAPSAPITGEGLLSGVDGSNFGDWGIGNNKSFGDVTPISDPLGTSLDPAPKNIWEIELTENEAIARCVNIENTLYKTITRQLL